MALRQEGEVGVKPKRMAGGRKPPHRSSHYWSRRRGAWLAGHYWLDKLIGFFLGYEVRRIKFQRRSKHLPLRRRFPQDSNPHQQTDENHRPEQKQQRSDHDLRR